MSNENKDLLYKIQLLKTALIQERTKIEPLEEKINVLNKEIIKLRRKPLTSKEYEELIATLETQNINFKTLLNIYFE